MSDARDETPVDGPLTGVDAVILAGGLGTRIRSVLGDTPKLLAPVGRSRVVDLMIAHLVRFGADRVVLALGHGAEAVTESLPEIVERIRRAPRGRPDFAVEAAIEPVRAGTAGAVRHVRSLLRPGPAVVMNGDTLTDADPGELLRRFREAVPPAAGGVMCVRVPDAGRFGRVELTADGRVARFVEKDPAGGPGLINAGIYVFSPELLDRIAAGDASSLESDVFRGLEPGSLTAVVAGGRFVDVGTPDGFREAAELFGA